MHRTRHLRTMAPLRPCPARTTPTDTTGSTRPSRTRQKCGASGSARPRTRPSTCTASTCSSAPGTRPCKALRGNTISIDQMNGASGRGDLRGHDHVEASPVRCWLTLPGRNARGERLAPLFFYGMVVYSRGGTCQWPTRALRRVTPHWARFRSVVHDVFHHLVFSGFRLLHTVGQPEAGI